MQRQTFYAKGLHWVFYFYNMRIWYRVSPDGLEWSDPVKVMSTGYSDFFSLHYDGTYLHYVGNRWSTTDVMWYRRGMPNSDGTITWDTDEQIITEITNYACDATITVDSEGYPWIGYYDAKDIWVPGVIKSRRNDGVWETASGFPYCLNPERSYYGVILVPLTSGKIYAVYFRSWQQQAMPMPTQPIYGKLWDREAWGEEEQVSTSQVANTDFNMISAVAYGDDVHVAFLKDLTYDIIHIKRTWDLGWSPEKVVQAAVSDWSPPVISYSRRLNMAYCFWAQDNRVYYKTYADNVWSELVKWVSEGEVITTNHITCFYEDYGSIIGVAWYLRTSELIRYSFIHQKT